ncbi:MAG TPA: cation diffusion facilitator family transporter [Candidatus Krumholzibacteria bacterium]|nr:cation diffusion facilitator family transporter [Candidatus Krumholzibacteria bacterium]
MDESRHHSHSHHGDHAHAHAGNRLVHGGHTHGAIDPSITTSARGIRAIKWSFVGLVITALIQVVVVWISGSVGLLADTIHNFADATTAIPLWVAFVFARRKPNARFTFGYGRVEDLAGVTIVLIIAFSAVVAGYEAVQRFLHPQPVSHLWAVATASIVSFFGNEAVAVLRIRVGRQIESAALVADGYHARVDALTSLAVLIGALGVWLGFPLADPIVGLLISIAIARIVWQSGKVVFTRLLDGVEPHLVDEIRHTAGHTPGVAKVTDVRARWSGHRLRAELDVAVAAELSVAEGHAIAKEVGHRLSHQFPYLSSVIVHVDPAGEAGEEFHHVHEHTHDGLPLHSH